MDGKTYPQGSKTIKSKYVNGQLVFYSPTDNSELFRIHPDSGYVMTNMARTYRARFTIAQVNAGATILAAVTGFKYRMLDCKIISVGGAAGAVTTVDILGTQSSSAAKLVAYAQASLTENTVLRDGESGAAVLAAGASYIQNDVSTAITIGKTGSSVTTATHFDVILSYALEA